MKRLRALVTVLTVVMIAGVITITALLVIRLNASRGEVVLVTPERFVLPEGVGVVGYSVVNGRTLIIGDDGVIRVFDSESTDLLQEITLD